jgi:hypothetical protein
MSNRRTYTRRQETDVPPSSLQTTKDADSHIAAEERAERVSEILDAVEWFGVVKFRSLVTTFS